MHYQTIRREVVPRPVYLKVVGHFLSYQLNFYDLIGVRPETRGDSVSYPVMRIGLT